MSLLSYYPKGSDITILNASYHRRQQDPDTGNWNPDFMVVSYKDIACEIGNPKAARAVGMANNKNKIIILVPCHRVIGSNGSLTGYAEGLDVKKYLLELEARYSK